MQQKNVQLQSLKQIQKLSPQQVLEVRILELSTEELVQRIETELLDNEALEKGAEEEENEFTQDEEQGSEDSFGASEDVLRDPEDDYDSGNSSSPSAMDVASWQIRNEVSFNDQLMEQLGEASLSEDEVFLTKYLIGSLEEDGLLHKDLQKIADELYLNMGVEVSPEELENCLKVLQQFEPAGIGGRNLQECLLLQVERRQSDALKPLLAEILSNYFDDLCGNRWEKIATQLQLGKEEVERIRKEMGKLNPRPGGSLFTGGPNTNSILPDFLLSVEDGQIQLMLNNAIVPALHVSESYTQAIEKASNTAKMSKKEGEELAYIRDKMERAQSFINAIRQRHTTLLNTMRAIIDCQKEYFLTGDESALRPLTMKEVAALAKVDISTVSRVCNSKYVQTPYGTYPLKRYFIERFAPKKNQTDEDITTQEVREKLKEIIDSEDKQAPYSDAKLQALLAKAGYDIARRTVAKYREQLGLESGRMRKLL